jgi:tetratricopeptide (TPR) repeat protein
VAENPRIEELRRRVQADPASIAFAALAEEFRRVGRYDDAIETCRTGLTRHPAYLSARVTLGRALIETGDYDGAREELETVLRSAPENLAAIRGIEQIHERLGHSAEMHPDLHADLHALAQQPIRVAAPPAPPVIDEFFPDPGAQLGTRPALSPRSLDSFDLPLAGPAPSAAEPDEEETHEPFDIFAAALQRSAPEPQVSMEPPAPEPATAPPGVSFEPPPVAFESATISFEAPVFAPPAPNASVDAPDPHVAAMLTRLERFLGAIRTARHA